MDCDDASNAKVRNIILRYTEEVLERLPARKRYQTAQFAISGYLDLLAAQRL